jgi:outer membrane immunogenic protein
MGPLAQMGVILLRIDAVAALAAVGIGAFASSAFAGPVPTWQGFYAGAFASNDLTSLHLDVPGEFRFDGISGETQSAGGLIGFNHRINSRWVSSAEIDASVAQGGTYIGVAEGGDSFGGSVRPEWGGSLKGRIGYLASPDTLFYGTAGGVVAVANYGCETTEGDCPERTQETLYGWPLVGFGAETRIGPHWRFRYEYDVKFLPTLSFDPIEVTPLSGTANIALIRDLGGMETDGAAGFGAAPMTWTGFYAGYGAGHQMSTTRFDGEVDDISWTFDGFGSGAVTGGGFGGYQQQFGPIVLGVEGGMYWNIGSLGAEVPGYGGFEVTANSFYDLRARAGVIVSPSTMIYALAGWLHGDGSITEIDTDGTRYPLTSFGRDGYEYGGGIETWLSKHWSVRAEYSYATFNNGFVDIPSDLVQISSHVGTGSVSAVFHFGS